MRKQAGRWTAFAALLAAGVAVTGFGATSLAQTATPVTATFAFSDGAQTYTVPAGVCQVTITAKGAAGTAIDGESTPGLGGEAVATVAVTAGQVLQVNVGGEGGTPSAPAGGIGGFNGGGDGGNASGSTVGGGAGGGASDVRTGTFSLADRIVVAGGGGGGANSANVHPGNGGGGGGTTGVTGTSVNTANAAGGGGTQIGPGPAGMPGFGTDGGPGVGATGGAGAPESSGVGPGGGGGGGFFGGGGGSSGLSAPAGETDGGGGGGGSGFTPTGTGLTPAVNAGNGSVAITSTVGVGCVTAIVVAPEFTG
jgi:hypothetical protein